jgi:outer membrane lipase/esterase
MKSPLFCRLLAAALLGIAPLLSQASGYDGVVIFGDSLSDSGNNALVIGTAPGQVITGNSYIPTFAYGSGTYSNADVWATSFAAGLGLSALPSLAGGSNYAYGGAETHGVGYPPNLQQQVGQFLGSGPGAIGDTLFVIAGGGNNARSALELIGGGAPIGLVTAIAAQRYANDIGAMVDTLQAAGAQHIVVWNTPDIGATPAVRAEGSAASLLGGIVATQMNNALAQRLAGEAGVLTFDIFGLVDGVVANPGAFGLLNASDACGAILGCDPGTFLFWDGIHPTSAGHAMLAASMLDLVAVVPEPGTAWLLAIGAMVVVLRRRRRRDQQASASAGARSRR